MQRSLAILDDPLLDAHRGPEGHPERPARLEAARNAVARLSVDVERLSARHATDDELCRVHTSRYVERLSSCDGQSGYLDADTYYAAESVQAARRAAGCSVKLVEHLLDHGGCGAALLRPPGHHARPDGAMGFCLLNNVAVSAAHALAQGAERVLILDWDVHHGNGTQEMFEADPRVLFASLHQHPFYPGTGERDECGVGNGRGYTVNIPLAAGAGDATYLGAMDRIIAPIAEQFAPSLVLVSAGFDAHNRDPLAGMQLSEGAFGAMTRQLIAAVGRAVPLGFVLEGGYDLSGLENSLHAAMTAAAGPDRPASAPPPSGDQRQTELAGLQEIQSEYWRF